MNKQWIIQQLHLTRFSFQTTCSYVTRKTRRYCGDASRHVIASHVKSEIHVITLHVKTESRISRVSTIVFISMSFSARVSLHDSVHIDDLANLHNYIHTKVNDLMTVRLVMQFLIKMHLHNRYRKQNYISAIMLLLCI